MRKRSGYTGKVLRLVDLEKLFRDYGGHVGDLEYRVHYGVSSYDPGRYGGPPEHCYPEEGGDLELFTEPTEDALRDACVRWAAEVLFPILRKTLECDAELEAYATETDDGPEWDEEG